MEAAGATGEAEHASGLTAARSPRDTASDRTPRGTPPPPREGRAAVPDAAAAPGSAASASAAAAAAAVPASPALSSASTPLSALQPAVRCRLVHAVVMVCVGCSLTDLCVPVPGNGGRRRRAAAGGPLDGGGVGGCARARGRAVTNKASAAATEGGAGRSRCRGQRYVSPPITTAARTTSGESPPPASAPACTHTLRARDDASDKQFAAR